MVSPTAKLWIDFQGAPVLLKMRPGEAIRIFEGGRTEEGHEWTESEFFYDGEFIHQEWHRDATDCDGRMESGGHLRVHIVEVLRPSGYSPILDYPEERHDEQRDQRGEPIRYVKWQKVNRSWQRDYQAERAGY